MISLKYYFFSKQDATSSIEESFKLGELRVGLLGWGGGLVFKNLVEEEGHMRTFVLMWRGTPILEDTMNCSPCITILCQILCISLLVVWKLM